MYEVDRKELHNILEEIGMKFFINQQKEDFLEERIYFLFEEAHWHLIDFYKITNIPFQVFCSRICKILNIDDFKLNLCIFNRYKKRIPVYGALIFSCNFTKLLVIKGCSKNAKYTFPKGKIDYEESGYECAIREVYEETGVDIRDKITRYMFKPRDRMILFLVPDIDFKTSFKILSKNEISDVRWVDIEELLIDCTEKYLNIKRIYLDIKKELDEIKSKFF